MPVRVARLTRTWTTRFQKWYAWLAAMKPMERFWSPQITLARCLNQAAIAVAFRESIQGTSLSRGSGSFLLPHAVIVLPRLASFSHCQIYAKCFSACTFVYTYTFSASRAIIREDGRDNPWIWTSNNPLIMSIRLQLNHRRDTSQFSKIGQNFNFSIWDKRSLSLK